MLALLGCLAVIVLVALLVFLLKEANRQGKRTPDHEQERTYHDIASGKSEPFGSLAAEPSMDISFVVPMYNEEERLPIMMAEAIAYIKKRVTREADFKCEFILVDDGSRDSTVEVAEGIARSNPECTIRILRLHQNHGKGGAVRKGMLRASGRLLLMVDADGATNFNDLEKLEKRLGNTALGVAVGSRAHLAADSVAERSLFRTILMRGFHLFVRVISGVRGIEDTQCGFKLFTRRAARCLFPHQHIERWAFDVELLYLAARQFVPLYEVAVNWQEIDGSKLDVASDSIQMARDLLLIRFCYLTGLWSLDSPDGKDTKKAK